MTNEAPPADSRPVPAQSGPKRKALGQGLSALLGPRPAAGAATAATATAPEPAPIAGQATRPAGSRPIPIEAIQPNPDQPRKRFSQQTLEELADSIRAHGLLQPIIVTPLRGAGADRFQLVAGERRWRAAQLAGLQLIPALVRDATRGQSLELALIENLQREDLNPMEAAQVFERLVEDFGLKHEEIAQRTGKDRATITNFLRLLRLPAEVQELVSAGKLSTGHAKALLAIASPQEQRRLAKKTVAKDLSVRVVEKLAARLARGAKPQPEQKQWDANIRSALADLERVLGTRVRLQGSAKKGKLLIEYYSPEDLMRIYDAIVK